MPAPIEEGYNQVLLKYLLKRQQLYWPVASAWSAALFMIRKKSGGRKASSIMPG
jgi:hypothetical protein